MSIRNYLQALTAERKGLIQKGIGIFVAAQRLQRWDYERPHFGLKLRRQLGRMNFLKYVAELDTRQIQWQQINNINNSK